MKKIFNINKNLILKRNAHVTLFLDHGQHIVTGKRESGKNLN
jgi:hypothetical protein